MQKQMDVDIVARHAPEAARLLKVLSHKARLLVLCNLCRGEKSVCDLTKILGLSQSGMSQHLGCLRHENIVKARKEKSKVFYSLAGHPAHELLHALCQVIEHYPALQPAPNF